MECVISIVRAMAESPLAPNLHWVFNSSLYIDYNRNQLVDIAVQNGSSHLLFVDSDIQFPPTGIEDLLASNKDIIGGYYNTRRGNCPVRIKDADGRLVSPSPLPTEPFKCHVLPTGFMLIDMEVFDKLHKPYFAVLTHANGTIGEDVYFCKQATDAGLELWCDPRIHLGHVGKHIY